MPVFQLKAERAALHGALSADILPAVTIDPGDSVEFETLEADWRTDRCSEPKTESGTFFPRTRETDCGQCLTGPVYVRGAEPGMTLAVAVQELVPGDWGWSRVGRGDADHLKRIGCETGEYFLIWDIDKKNGMCMSNEGHRVAMRPFMGIYAVVPAGEGVHTTYVPGKHGGNMDCRELIAGSTIYLPVYHEGALFSVGDGHAAQGNGELGCTAIECPYDKVRLGFEVIGKECKFPFADTPAGWITFGYGEDLTDAAYMALEHMVLLMMERYGMHRREALMMASLLVDIEVTQLVNGVRGAHAVLPHGSIEKQEEKNGTIRHGGPCGHGIEPRAEY